MQAHAHAQRLHATSFCRETAGRRGRRLVASGQSHSPFFATSLFRSPMPSIVIISAARFLSLAAASGPHAHRPPRLPQRQHHYQQQQPDAEDHGPALHQPRGGRRHGSVAVLLCVHRSFVTLCVDCDAVAVRMLPPSEWRSSPPCDPDDSDYEGETAAETNIAAADSSGSTSPPFPLHQPPSTRSLLPPQPACSAPR